MVKININDVKDVILIPDNIWEEIFAKQRLLAEKYSEIEGMGNLLETTGKNIDTLNGQKWIKDFAWRVTEELAEAWEAYESEHIEHFKEELADSLHFLVELSIIAGYNYDIIPDINSEILKDEDIEPWNTVYYLGLMCNTLKNKPWKQSQMLTDWKVFDKHLKNAWLAFLKLIYYHIGEDEEVYKYYFKKNKVNQFRQRSKY